MKNRLWSAKPDWARAGTLKTHRKAQVQVLSMRLTSGRTGAQKDGCGFFGAWNLQAAQAVTRLQHVEVLGHARYIFRQLVSSTDGCAAVSPTSRT